MKLKQITITFIFFIMSIFSFAQNGVHPMAGARGVAMGDAAVAFNDINSAFSNQAGLAFLDGLGFALGAERRFLTSEINSVTAAFAYPTSAGTFGLAANYYGFSGYNEQRIGISYARKLMSKLAIGAQIDYLGFAIPEYGNKSIITFELGFQAQLIENLYVGAHVFNPIRQEIVENEKVPTIFRLGASYNPTKKLIISSELEKDMDYDMVFKAGIEYFLIDILALRVGVSTNPTLNSFGLGLKLKNGLKIDVASSYHYALGFTPAFTLSYEMGKKDTSSK